MKRRSGLNRITLFDVVNAFLVIAITVIVAYPLYFCVVASFSDPSEVAAGHTLLWVKDFTVDAYRNIMKESRLWTGYRNTVLYTILGTGYNLLLTIPVSYVLTKQYMPFRGLISWYFFLTMYVSGGMIPTYLLMKNLNLINHPLALIIGAGVSCYNMIVARQYFATGIHPDVYEAAYIDGASEMKCFMRIALPLAKPIIAVLTLYYGVGHWNSYYNALLYIYKPKYYPLQLVLRDILITNQQLMLDAVADEESMRQMLDRVHAAEGMKYAVIFIASAPLLAIYPFLQKYFAKGVMIGAVKG